MSGKKVPTGRPRGRPPRKPRGRPPGRKRSAPLELSTVHIGDHTESEEQLQCQSGTTHAHPSTLIQETDNFSDHFDRDQMISHRQLKKSAIPKVFNVNSSHDRKNFVNNEERRASSRKSSRIAQQKNHDIIQIELENELYEEHKVRRKKGVVEVNRCVKMAKIPAGHNSETVSKRKLNFRKKSLNTSRLSQQNRVVKKPSRVWIPSYMQKTREKTKSRHTYTASTSTESTTTDSSSNSTDSDSEIHEISVVKSNEQLLEEEANNLREINKDLENANEVLRKNVEDWESKQALLIKDKALLKQEINDFKKNNSGMVHAIYELEKHNTTLSNKLSELKDARDKLRKEIKDKRSKMCELYQAKLGEQEVLDKDCQNAESEVQLVKYIKKKSEYVAVKHLNFL